MQKNRPIRVLIPERRTFNLNSQSVYVRVVEPMRWLKEQGLVEYAIVSEFDRNALFIVNWADVVIFNKHSSGDSYELACHAKALKKKIIYDIDDNIFNVPDNLNVFSRNHEDSLRIIKLASVLIVENTRLFNAMKPYHADLVVIPNGIFVDKYSSRILKNNKGHTCLFSSYVPSLNKFIRTFVQVLHDFQLKNPSVRFDLYGNNAMDFPADRVIPPSCFSDFMSSIVACRPSMAIVPIWGSEDLSSAAYRDCKSPIKYIMYGLARIPTVFTDAMPYTTCVVNEENGLLVNNDYESWFYAMSRIYKDNKLRKKIQHNAYRDVCENFNIKKSAMAYYGVLKKI